MAHPYLDLSMGDEDRPALLATGRPGLTRGQLGAQIDGVAAALVERGLQPGDTIGLLGPGGPELAVAFLAVSSVAAAAPINPGLRPAELAYEIADLRMRAVVVIGPAHPVEEEAGDAGVAVWRIDTVTAGAAVDVTAVGAGPRAAASGRRFPTAARPRCRPRAAHERHHGPAEGRAVVRRQPGRVGRGGGRRPRTDPRRRGPPDHAVVPRARVGGGPAGRAPRRRRGDLHARLPRSGRGGMVAPGGRARAHLADRGADDAPVAGRAIAVPPGRGSAEPAPGAAFVVGRARTVGPRGGRAACSALRWSRPTG